MNDTVRRELHAILAADVVGFSSMMESDEEATMITLRAYREEIDRIIVDHDGRIIHTAGDSVVAVFDSVTGAVECATQFQQAVEARNAIQLGKAPMQFRIGINVGDLMITGKDLLGTGINIAARIESIADPGSVWISEVVYDYVQNSPKFVFEDKGLHEVKNIKAPVRAFSVRPARAAKPVSKTEYDAMLETTSGRYFTRIGSSIELGRAQIQVGANIVTRYRKASRLGNQCLISFRDREFLLRDCGSTNGTFLNERFLGNGELVTLDPSNESNVLSLGGTRTPPVKGPCRFNLQFAYSPDPALVVRVGRQTYDLIDPVDMEVEWPDAERDFQATWVFSPQSLLIGGDQTCAIRLRGLRNSDAQARLAVSGTGFVVTAEGGAALSVNGTPVDKPTELTDGDTIDLDGEQIYLRHLAD